MFRQRREKIEFAGRERDVLAARGDESAAASVEKPTVKPNDFIAVLRTSARPNLMRGLAGAARF